MGKAEFRLKDPEEAPMTMEITMTLKRWKELRRQLREGSTNMYPASWLKKWIIELTDEAEVHFEAEEEEDPDE